MNTSVVDIERRRLLAGLASGAAVALLSPFARSAGIDYPFTLGVASGDPWPDGFVIWTRLAPLFNALDGRGGLSQPVPVRWKVASDANMTHIVKQGEVRADARLAYSVHVEVGGLQAGRPYWYQFEALGAQSPLGRSLTAPAASALVPARVGFVSCAHWELGYFSAYRHLANEQPDLVFFLGDYIYEYSNPKGSEKIVRPHGSGESLDLPGYRNRYALYRTDPDLQALHACAPSVVTWDDHEVQNDYANQWSQDPKVSPEAFLQRRAAAYQAFYEHMPLRASSLPKGPDMRLYRRLDYGQLVRFHILDDRQYRSRQGCFVEGQSHRGRVASPDCNDLRDPARSMLGLAQESWLEDGFRQSTARWNVIAQGLLTAPLLQPDARTGTLGHWTDGWDGYMSSRERMLAALQRHKVSNPVIWSGDIHSFWANDLHARADDPGSPIIASELVGTSVTSDGPPHQRFSEAVLPNNPHVHFFDSRQRGYVSVDISAQQMNARFQVISDRRDPKASVSTLKRFVIQDAVRGITIT